MTEQNKRLDFSSGLDVNLDTDKDPNAIIKVIGVGGGGGNAVNHMYRQGIHNVNFVVCNTDRKALEDSPVQTRVQLGEGLGAGNKPDVARKAAEEGVEAIRSMLNDGTKMVFITAGMGGGTGTGAAPIVAREAKSLDILTVGIVTIPFKFEGIKKIDQALDGVEEIAKHVDALLVINNERLREIYPDLTLLDAFAKADDTLSVAAKSIAEIITSHGKIGLDFNDVRTVLKDGGVAIMSMGLGEGENRLGDAIKEALNSPLLNNNDIFNSKKILLSLSFSKDPETGKDLMMEEINQVHEFMSNFGQDDHEFKWGISIDESLGRKVKVTLLATGFGIDDVPGMFEKHEAARSLEEQVLIEEEQEKMEQRRRKFYQTEENKNFTRKRFQVFIFGEKDLDNADVISAVDTTPTYKRSRETLDNIRKKAITGIATEPSSDNASNVITFTS